MFVASIVLSKLFCLLYLYFFRIFARYIYRKQVELIANILIEYLKHNKRLVVPKLGAFIVKQPSGVIRFSELIRTDDGVLRSLLMAYGAKEIEACGMIDRFVFEVHHAISQGDIYVVEGFGEFTPGENNTIAFKHKIEPKTYGGRIKPPVETFEMEKLRMLRAMGRDIKSKPPVAHEEKPKTKRAKSTTEENISIVKPDAYLRGLKYDNEKKRRNDDRSENRGGGKRGVIVTILLLSLLSAAIVWGVWQWRGGITNNEVVVNYPTATIAPDTLLREDRDTLHRDTAAVESLDDISKDVSPSNSYLNPKFNKN